jgi:hypothetical protein
MLLKTSPFKNLQFEAGKKSDEKVGFGKKAMKI